MGFNSAFKGLTLKSWT